MERILYDPKRKDNILGRNKNATGTVGRAPQTPDRGLGRSFEVRGEFVLKLGYCPRDFLVEVVFNGLWPRGLRHGAKDVGTNFCGKMFGLTWILGTACVCAHLPRIGTFQESMGRMVSSSFFLWKKEPMVLSELVEFGPCFLAETVKACALICLHMMAEENRILLLTWVKCGSMAAQKGPVWSDNGLEGERSEDSSSVGYYEHNVHNLAIEVVGQNWSSEVISLFLDDWEVGRVALSCLWTLCAKMRDAWGEVRVSGLSSLLVFGGPGKKEEVF